VWSQGGYWFPAAVIVAEKSVSGSCLDQPAMALAPNKRPIYLAPPLLSPVSSKVFGTYYLALIKEKFIIYTIWS